MPPGPGQESVWDYPRPPRLEPVGDRVRIEHQGVMLAETRDALRVLETSHPPTVYVPPEDVDMSQLARGDGSSFCEWKGRAHYYDLVMPGGGVKQVAWAYADPTPGFAGLKGYLAFYPSKVDACYVGDDRVTPQEGDFYGGWITSKIVGPFKGAPGTMGW